MSFVDIRGRLYPISSIERMVPSGEYLNGTKRSAKIYFKDGDETGIEVWDQLIERIHRLSMPCISAAPGFRLLTFAYDPASADDPGPWIHSEPILGWRVTEWGNHPLVVDCDFATLDGRHAVRDLAGGVFNWERNFGSEAEWIEAMKREADEEHAWKLAVAEAGMP